MRDSITLVSPSGRTFVAAWMGNPRTVEKKLGIFSYPKIPGAIVQDLDVDATRYPLTIYFEGEDNDLDADAFFESCKERGTWTVDHPVRGQLTLQLVTATEEIQPVSSGNITAVNTEWIEPIDPSVTASVSQRSIELLAQAETIRNVASEQLAAVVELDTPSKLTQFKNAVEKAASLVDNTLAPLRQQVASVNASVLSVKRGITSALNESALNVLGLGGQLQTLVSLPGDSITDISVRIDYYSGLIANMAGFGPSTPTSGGVNTAAVQEIVLTAAVSSIVTGMAEGELDSREDAISYLESAGAAFVDITETLDDSQALYQDNIIDNQYFSQSQSFNDLAYLVGLVTALLLRKSFDLAAAKRFTLKRSRTPAEISATEYGDLTHLDFFISSNRLKGNDILLLPAGREVVVYL